MQYDDDFAKLSCCENLNLAVSPEIRKTLLRMAHSTIHPPQRLHETNAVVRWIEQNSQISKQQAALLAVELNGGFLLMDDANNATLFDLHGEGFTKATKDVIDLTEQLNLDLTLNSNVPVDSTEKPLDKDSEDDLSFERELMLMVEHSEDNNTEN